MQKRHLTSALVIRVKGLVDDSHRESHSDWSKATIARQQESQCKYTHSGDEPDKKSIGDTRQATHSTI